MSCRPPFSLSANEVCLACEEDVTAGDLGTNDSYDLYLLSRGNPVKEYVLVCFMNLQFFFSNKGGSWTEFEKSLFVSRWQQNILSVWNRKLLRVISGKQVALEFKFKTKIGGTWLYDHWEITVVKTQQFARSYVNTFWGNSRLDDLDFTATLKASDGKQQYYQRGAVHEFGHMLGLKDEYKNSIWIADQSSIMNSGEVVKGRHLKTFANWTDKQLLKLGIK